LILDFIPNHMGIGKNDNEWWLDLLEWGQNSIYSDYFDVDWSPQQHQLAGKVLVPLLGDHYGAVLERGELALRFERDAGSFSVWYHEHRLPIRPRHYAIIIRRHLAESEVAPPLDNATRTRLADMAGAFDKLRRPERRR